MARDFADKIRSMFDTIAPTYDKLNRINTFGLDLQWRKELVNRVAQEAPQKVLDLAAGTGDLSIMLAKACRGASVVAGDMSEGMLQIAKEKAIKAYLPQIEIQKMDAMNLPYEEQLFDAVTCAFGVRNFESIARSYHEIYRVLKPGGVVAILELCEPKGTIMHNLYSVHVYATMPLIASAIGQNKWAYQYLAKSIEKVPQREEMTRLMDMAGFFHTYHKVFMPGVCALYVGFKPTNEWEEKEISKAWR